MLMYHGTPSGKGQPCSSFSVSARAFADQLGLLRRYGWHTARVCDLASGNPLPPRTVILTFDDGYADNYQGAFLELQRHRMQATWFIVTERIGRDAHWLEGPAVERALLNRDQLLEMAAAGIEIASHTCSHADLSRLYGPALEREIRQSREILSELLGRPVETFAYPYGRFHEAAEAEVRQCGYRLACSTRAGWAYPEREPYRLRRVAVYYQDSLSTFARKLVFAINDGSWRRFAAYGWERISERVGLRNTAP